MKTIKKIFLQKETLKKLQGLGFAIINKPYGSHHYICDTSKGNQNICDLKTILQ